MRLDQQKLRQMIGKPVNTFDTAMLRRDGNVFFVGGDLPVRETLETIFDSHCQVPAELFCLTISSLNTFHQGEELARQLKKNFNTHLLVRLNFPAPAFAIERAYAAGADILDIPLHLFDQALAGERGLAKEERLQALRFAQGVLPRWGVASTLMAGEEPSCSTISAIDTLAGAGIIPLVDLSPRAARYPQEEIAAIFSHLTTVWKKRKMIIKPLLPLVSMTTPLDIRPRGMLKGLMDKIYDRQLLATSDLRRSLKVRQIDASFDSAGL
ncbi:hypothetical protein [Geotalea sp. SG265]|uniref:hypothetical protein n=1 Tax=Geotalea sp. SG265 TaxID=2922867 RepID=UPI001FAFD586|nr:hypothetical protein [Geotalea sp. SG265]